MGSGVKAGTSGEEELVPLSHQPSITPTSAPGPPEEQTQAAPSCPDSGHSVCAPLRYPLSSQCGSCHWGESDARAGGQHRYQNLDLH